MKLTTELGLHIWGAYETSAAASGNKAIRKVYVQPIDSLRFFNESHLLCIWIDYGDHLELVSILRAGGEGGSGGVVRAVFRCLYILEAADSLSKHNHRSPSNHFSLTNIEVSMPCS